MTVAQSRTANTAEQIMLKAAVVSLAIHLIAWGGWKWGQTHAWWKHSILPAWLQVLPHNFNPNLVRHFPAIQTPQPPPLLYVDVDPALAAAQPPANPKFYSTADTLAANPEKKVPSDQPQISGTQDKMMKTVAAGVRAAAPLQPSPPEQKEAKTAAKEAAESKALPKQSYTPGDLANAKPAAKTEEKKGTSETDHGTDASTEPPHQRPRTLAEARERSGAPGPKTQQDGGVNHVAIDSSVDAMRTVYGDYDQEMIDAIEARWNELLRGRQDAVSGKVVLEFNLHADGRVTDMKMQFSDVNDLLSIICQQAVLDPARYKIWPQKMRQAISDPRQVRITFNYLPYSP